MSSNIYLRASIAAILGTASFAASAQQADQAEPEELEVVRVTGSRVITDNLRSPTPITSVSVDEISKTTPSDIPDALNKLPEILGGRTPRTQGNASTNNGGNVLSLRNFGVSRTLVLLDGHRVPPSNQDGSVNVDILPQMLIKQVDIVTGGASAVYGSDAVAGVVNFILDKSFTGLKVKADVGISEYGDGEQGQFGAAWGTELFGGRGHFMTSARYRAQAMIPIHDRPYGKDGQTWLLTGNGSPTNPFTNTPYARVYNSGPAGNISCGSACLYNNYTFSQPGVLSPGPLVHGARTGTANVESGGDGAYVKYGTFRSGIDMKDWFGRLSYDFTDNVNGYVQATWAQAGNESNWIQWVVSPAANRPNSIFANNPFLSTATQEALGANIVCTQAMVDSRERLCLPFAPATSPQTGSRPPPPPTTPFVRVPSYIWNKVGGEDAESTNRLYITEADQRNTNFETGLTGSLGAFEWDVFYSHGQSRLKVTNPNNTDNGRYLAALDAVIAPPGTMVNGVNVGGTIVCWVTIQPEFANLYPGCVPANITDPNGPSVDAYNYLRRSTSWTLRQKLDNVGASIGGGLWGLGLPAGEIKANLSLDARWATYDMESDALPTEFVNCTGLRMCLSNVGAPVRWVQNTNAPVEASNSVWEVALEVNVPLLSGVPAVQELSTNWAGRYTKYSSFDAVQSWKGGLDWHLNDTIRFRGTLSADIRAPNLNDLFQPAGVSSTNFTDNLLIGSPSNTTRLVSRGNPDLTPEKARTVTVGMVLTPSFIENLNVSVDYYRTKMTDSIIPINYAGVQGLCIASAPNYDSPFCSLAVRPITNPSDPNYRTIANFPLEIRNSPLNAARLQIKGWDFQLNYGWEMWSGRWSFRHLVNYQPLNETINLPGQVPTWAREPKLRQSTFLSYGRGDWNVALQNQWLGRVKTAISDNAFNGNNQNYAEPYLKAYDVLDVTINKSFQAWGADNSLFLTVNNVRNTRAPLYGSDSGLPGLFYPTLPFYDDMGRYYTVGIRANF
jgi:outer membrane receptor protein involved in Fe transport